ncbi:AAA family ATPase [Archangium violaceum]|uniref:AAA family ATPase n=1 Tax=Archangium violaceum TaxID=83451 RepID=UPI002B2ABC1D|nr:AAA family ATPase [Archangium gephyra]
MLERLELHHVGPAPQLEFDFASRLNLLTGDNGLGKTFILDVAWWALTRSWAGHPASPHRGQDVEPSISFRYGSKTTSVDYSSTYDFQAQAWTPKRGRPGNPGLVLYARVDGSFSVWDPARNYWKEAPTLGIDAPDRPRAYHFAPTQVWDGLEPDGKVLSNGLIRDWASWQGRNNEPYRQLLKVLEVLSPSDEERIVPGELTRLSLEDVRDMPTLQTPYGQEVPVVHASAGFKRIISLAYLLVWAWNEHIQASRLLKQDVTREIIFLFDEIEAHLHPRWQRTILRSLLSAITALSGADDVKVQVIAVTHSPLLLASLEPLFDPSQDALWHMELVNGAVSLKREIWRRRGDANSWLISGLFDLKEPRSLEAEQALQQAEGLMRRENVQRAEFDEVLRKLRESLPDVDPFWVQWRFWARQSGFEP